MSSIDYNIPTKSGVKPSIFEVFAVESLSSGLRNAFQYLLKVLSENHPDRYQLLYHYSNEFYLLLDLAVQHYCLRTHSASFAENFYGLMRVPTSKFGKLNRFNVYRSLFLIVGVPYLRILLHQHYKKENDLYESAVPTNEDASALLSRLRALFVRMYPYVHLVVQTVNMMYQLLYATGKCRQPSPMYHLSLTELYAVTKEDLLEASSASKDASNQRWCQHLKALLHTIASGLSTGVSLGAFLLQFLDWWYNREGVSLAFQPLPIPQPPSKYPTELVDGNCPLCFQKITKETLLTISGFVFCFRCIYSHLKKSPVCPVTRLPATTDHLVRLYIPTE